VRAGLEDNFYLDGRGKVMAKSNGELVEKAVRMARDIGREPATVDEARVLIGLPAGRVSSPGGPARRRRRSRRGQVLRRRPKSAPRTARGPSTPARPWFNNSLSALAA
jgi:hypothetical protein